MAPGKSSRLPNEDASVPTGWILKETDRLAAVRSLYGTLQRSTYTCVGNTVNLAARLEAHTKVVGEPTLIDETTKSGLIDKIKTVD
jgi:class 3 adenylate cyclase